jgi:hypothetical protein
MQRAVQEDKSKRRTMKMALNPRVSSSPSEAGGSVELSTIRTGVTSLLAFEPH